MSSEPTPEAWAIERDLERAARDVLAGMAPHDAEAIVAAIGDRRPHADSTFRKRLQRALRRLRVAWKAKHETQ